MMELAAQLNRNEWLSNAHKYLILRDLKIDSPGVDGEISESQSIEKNVKILRKPIVNEQVTNV